MVILNIFLLPIAALLFKDLGGYLDGFYALLLYYILNSMYKEWQSQVAITEFEQFTKSAFYQYIFLKAIFVKLVTLVLSIVSLINYCMTIKYISQCFKYCDSC